MPRGKFKRAWVALPVGLALLGLGAYAALTLERPEEPTAPAGSPEATPDDPDADGGRRDEAPALPAERPWFEPSPLDFSFIVDADARQVLIAQVSRVDALRAGDVTWAGQPFAGADIVMRSDVDPAEVPAELLGRRGEAFVAHDARGGTCRGRLGELSLLRWVSRSALAYALHDSDEEEITDDEFEFLKGLGQTPPTDRINTPSFYWDRPSRTYLVARWETDEDCGELRWGHAPDHAPTHYRETSTHQFDAQASRAFRAHPGYAAQQELYDRSYDSLVQIAEENADYGDASQEWTRGPWENGFFTARVFAAADGRRLLVAAADQTDECADGGPSRLLVMYDITTDGRLEFRADIGSFPHDGYRSFIEREGILHYLTERSLIGVDDYDIIEGYGDGNEVNSGCW